MFRYRCPLKPPVFPIRAVTIDTLMEGLSSLTYILLVALCAGDQINHILGFAVCLMFETQTSDKLQIQECGLSDHLHKVQQAVYR